MLLKYLASDREAIFNLSSQEVFQFEQNFWQHPSSRFLKIMQQQTPFKTVTPEISYHQISCSPRRLL